MVFSEFYSRCQVDLIDFQWHLDGKYRLIMVYQDHLFFCFIFAYNRVDI